jgi:hypothetical protein
MLLATERDEKVPLSRLANDPNPELLYFKQ